MRDGRLSLGVAAFLLAVGSLKAQNPAAQFPLEKVLLMTEFGHNFHYSISSVEVYVPDIRLDVNIGHRLGLTPEEIRRNCTGTFTGQPTDADRDGFPVHVVYTFKCNFRGYELSGRVSVRDNNDGNPYSGADFCTGIFTPAGCSREPLKYGGYDYYVLDIDSEYHFAKDEYLFKRYFWTVYGITCEAENLTFKPKRPTGLRWDRGVWNGKIVCSAIPSYKYVFVVENWQSGMCMNADTPAGGTIRINASCSQNPSERQNVVVNYTSCGHGKAVGNGCNGIDINTDF
ncbi:hypothetical protein BCF55_1695 [Hydrogenivirga caldilitoris]|uniref:Uncharacterized protein n=1 Tax=Hydrogenivirga caldilitoris TaxID=246264 RepID=A0A497XXA0_9AQUI|nr:hypothetical protein [Hydrogenivirga caldilitoris]RLJ71393.1 hypothetical protein BCF55_1695 [Hydrogenivirga caldilitoris]